MRLWFPVYSDGGQPAGTQAQQCAQASRPPGEAVESKYTCLGDHEAVQS